MNKYEEDNKMTKAQVEVTVIEVGGIIYTQTRPGYYYKKVDGKQTRIPKAEWEQAFEAYVGSVDEADEQWDTEDDVEARKEIEEQKDKETEDAFNKQKKVRKPRRSKDVAFEMDLLIGHVTLTARQVDFIKHLPDTCFWENGLDSALWCDILADEIGGQFAGKPMTVGAMISTLREKDLVVVDRDTSRQGKPKYMALTDLGKAVAKKLGLN